MAAPTKRDRQTRKDPGPGAETIAALKCLRKSGQESFEDLVATLLSALAEIPFRLCRSGLQPGVDALSTGFVGVEVKRYADSVPIRDLQGALSDAAAPELGLHLWVAVSTTSVGGPGQSKLIGLGSQLGVGVLILDADYARPSGVSPVAALCATNPDAVLHAVENWRDPKKSEKINLDSVRRDLQTVHELPGFNAFVTKLRADLREGPIWPLLIRRQNRGLANQILENPFTWFHVPYEQNRSVRRKVEDGIETWLRQAVGPVPGLAAVVGERFDGKTWCVLDWLVGRLEALPIPVFFVPSLAGDGEVSLENIILEQIQKVLGSFGRHASELLRRVRHQPPELGPWALIILDGLDEYRFHDPDQHLAWAPETRHKAPEVEVMGQPLPSRDESPEESAVEDIRPCAVLCTCRRPFWQKWESRIEQLAHGRVSVLPIGPYDDEEFASALAIENRPPDIFDGLPEEVQKWIRRPRYLRLLLDKLPQLGRYHEVTEDLLFWFDAQDEIRRNRPGVRDWTESVYQEVLQDLARGYIQEGWLRNRDVRSALGSHTDANNVSAALQDLESEGILELIDGKYQIRPEQVRVGMGLHLLDLLKQAKIKQRDLATELRAALEPPDSDPKVEWLRWATIVSLDREGTAPDVVDTLVAAWLRSRNLPREDIEQIRRLSSRLFGPILRLAPESWSSVEGNERVREISKLVILDHLESKKEEIGEHARSWMRLVPSRGPYFVEDEPGAAETIRSALADPSLQRWELRPGGDSGILWLQGFGLYLESLSPGMIGPEDLLALMAVRHIPMYHFNSFVDSENLLFRRRLAEVPRSWFEEKAREATASPGTLRAKIIYHFLLAADRADLLPLAEAIAPAEEPRRSRRPQRGCPMDLLRRHSHDVRDPSFPRPSEPDLASLRSAWAVRFAEVKLADDPSLQTTSEDLDFERTLPSIAAWAPDLGAELIRRQMRDLPTTVSKGRHLWARSIERHAVLAEGEVRAPLIEVTRRESNDLNIGLAVGHVLVSLLPAMSSTDLLDAVLDHHIGFEWRDLFDVAPRLRSESLRDLLLKRIEAEHDSRRLARSYYLLSNMATAELPPAQGRKVVYSVDHGEGDERIAALAVAKNARIFNIPAEILLPIATGSDRKTLAPLYAGWLLAQKGEAVDRLPARWRAVAAAKHRRFREPFLREVETALGIREEEGNAVSIRNEHESTWHSKEFPRSLVDGLSEPRFRRWAKAVQSGVSGMRDWWTGLLIPLFRRALVKGYSLAEPLWSLVYPFQRERFGGGTQFLRGYIDRVLCDLASQEADDQTAKHLLHGLILDCRSDRELLEVALGARYEGQSRIESVLESLLGYREPETRAKIARLLGWLEGSEPRLREIAGSDPSLWVRRIAESALKFRRDEGFSHHWFEAFLQGESREVRWGAGQLFLETVDAGGMIWARRFLRDAPVDARTHGEAILLLRSAEQEVKNRSAAWGKTFLGYSVSDLERLWEPWQHRPEWDDLE